LEENDKLEPNSENLAQELFGMLHSQGLCFKANKKSDDKKKYPKKLYRFEEDSEGESDSEGEDGDVQTKNIARRFGILDTSGYYILLLAEPKSQMYFYLMVIVIGIFAYCLLPVWPLQLKILIWWVSYILLIIMLGIVIVRYSLHLFMLIFGKDFWLFPDLFNDHVIFFSMLIFITFRKVLLILFSL